MESGKKKFLVAIPVILAVLIAVYYVLNPGFFVFDECAGIKDPLLRKECYTGKAIRGGDSSICENIGEEDGCEECRDAVEQIMEPGVSGGGGSSSDDSDSGGSSGVGEFENPFEACEALSGSEKDWCIRDIAVEEGSPSVCLLVEDQYYRDSCYRFIALDTGDSSYCDYMKDAKRVKWCHEAFD